MLFQTFKIDFLSSVKRKRFLMGSIVVLDSTDFHYMDKNREHPLKSEEYHIGMQ